MRYCGEHEIKTLYGYQILAADGSGIVLPDVPDLLETFGGTGRNAGSPTGEASILYDVLNDFILGAALEEANFSERELANAHLACRLSVVVYLAAE